LPKPETLKTGSYVAPGNRCQEQLAGIWADILKLEPEQISIDADFFEIGGHSLKATILIARIHKTFNVKIPLARIFKDPTIRGLDRQINDSDEEAHVSIAPAPLREYYELSSAQKRLYFIQQMDRGSTAYNMLLVVNVEGNLDSGKLETVVRCLIGRHESLRTAFVTVGNRPVQQVIPFKDVEFAIRHYDLETSDTNGGSVESILQADFVRPFDLSYAPLLRIGLIRETVDRHVLIINMHHIISDGTSQTIFNRELMALYNDAPLPALTLQYRDYSHWQKSNRETLKQQLKKQEEYWLDRFSGGVPRLTLASDYPRPDQLQFEGSRTRFEIGAETTLRLKEYAAAEDATFYMLMLAIYTVFLHKVSGEEDIVVGSPVAGRSHIDLETMMGMFVNTLPFRNRPTRDKPFRSFFREVRENALQVLANQDYTFEDLVKKVVDIPDHGRNPLFDVVLAVQNMDFPEIEAADLRVSLHDYYSLHQVSKFDLGFYVHEFRDELTVLVEYNTKLFKLETMDMFITNFNRVLEIVMENPAIQLNDIEISDNLETAETDVSEIDLGF
ncbi:MAG: non-ribosomal peptide synthetase, partial [bacterium]|nr:non-ribosomal peptide synthetase [bacterium]